jgi:hypothetical protein
MEEREIDGGIAKPGRDGGEKSRLMRVFNSG